MRTFLFLFVAAVMLTSGFAAAEDPALPALREYIEEQTKAGAIDSSREGWKSNLPRFPEVPLSEEGFYEWTLETTEGTMVFRLDHDAAPEHVRSVLYLTTLGFYEDLVFHRIIPGFVAQGACPLGRGTGGPGYNLPLEVKPGLRHRGAGVLSMARTARPDSAGSQFFITFADAPHLDGQYSIFGRMLEGEETLAVLEEAGDPDPRNRAGTPRSLISIERASVRWVDEPDEE